jgi:hypothetical protein
MSRRERLLWSAGAAFLLALVLMAAAASANPSDPPSSLPSQENGPESANQRDTEGDAEDLLLKYSIHLPYSSLESLGSKEERLHGAALDDSPFSKRRQAGQVKAQY